MNKKISLILYYIGLLLGTIIMNYIIIKHEQYAENLLNDFRNIMRLIQVDRRAIFGYLFTKRIRQILMICFVYFQISKQGTLFCLDIYFGIFTGAIVSFFSYYYNFGVAVGIMISLIPQYIYYSLLKNIGWKLVGVKKIDRCIRAKTMLFVFIVVTIVLTIVEMTVNYGIIQRIFTYK